MAFIANTAFEVKVSNHEFNSLANITGMGYGSGAPVDISAGQLCVRMDRLENEGYGPEVRNHNTWSMGSLLVLATGNEPIYACNPFDVNMVTDASGNAYKVGARTLGLGCPAGYRTTFTQIYFDNVHQYRFGEGNFTTAGGSSRYATIAANGLLTPADDEPTATGTRYFEIIETGNFTEGAQQSFGYVDVIARIV